MGASDNCQIDGFLRRTTAVAFLHVVFRLLQLIVFFCSGGVSACRLSSAFSSLYSFHAGSLCGKLKFLLPLVALDLSAPNGMSRYQLTRCLGTLQILSHRRLSMRCESFAAHVTVFCHVCLPYLVYLTGICE